MSVGSVSHNDLEDILDTLEDNIGRVITVFTQSGGDSGSGFTGLLTEVEPNFIKLITSFSSPPRNPFNNNNNNNSRFGTAVLIPINKIVSVVFNEL